LKKVLSALIIAVTFYSAAYCGVIYYDDPISVGIGARPIGMGRAFVAVADDPNAMYLNPAGLGSQKTWQITTSGSNFLDEYQYTMLSGVNPTPSGVFGIGYVLSKISGIEVLSGSTIGTVDFYNQALVLSYGKNIGDNLPFLGNNPELYGGAALKYYWKGYTGVINLNATGYNLDLGLKYSPEERMSYGLTFQNVIGGSQMTGDFDPEDMPFTAKIGLAYNWLEQNVTIALDKDMYPDRPKVPWPMHFGAEWRVHPSLSLRAGYDQVASSADNGDLTNNTTFGVGLDYSGVKIDLAYMQNYAATNLASNVISLSFYSQPFYTQAPSPEKGAAPKPAAPAVSAKTVDKKISVIPSSDLYTLNSKQVFSGAIDFDVTDVWIDGRKLQIRSDRAFQVSIPLNVGKNEKIIRVRDTSSAEGEIKRKIIRFCVPLDLSFEEVTKKDFAYKVIYTEIYRYLGKGYRTDHALSREILALIISKAKKLKLRVTPASVSSDVDGAYWAAGFIRAVKSAGIMSDYSDGTFKVDRLVTGAELADIMAKAGDIDKASIMVYLATKSPEVDASIEDLVELIYLSGMLEKDIDSYKAFIGAEGFMEEAIPPVKEAVPSAPEIPIPPTPEAEKVPAKPITDKINIVSPQDKTDTFDSEITFNGKVDPDVKEIWINDKTIPFKPDGTFSQKVPLEYGKNQVIVRIKDAANNEGTISINLERHYLPKGVATEEAKGKYIDKTIIQTKVHDLLGKDYSPNDRISREQLDAILKKIKERQAK